MTTATSPSTAWCRTDLVVILVAAMAMAATYPGRTHGLGMVTEPLLVDLNLSSDDGRVFFATLNFWATLVGSLFCIPIGWLFDRFDRRWVLAVNLVSLGAVVAWMSSVTTWQALAVALTLTRGLGQSALSVVSITIVAKSFSAQRIGLAMAWYAILSAPFHLLLIKGVGWAFTIPDMSWRTVWCTVGTSLIALSSASMLLKKALPETNSLSSNRAGFTLRQALATPAFWVIGLTISVWGMIYSGVSLFNEDIFRERGFDRTLYFNILTMVTIVALASKLFFGWLVNYIPLTRLLSVCLLITALSLLGLTFASQTWHAYIYGIGLGIASGAVALLFFATWGKLYGQKELGRIQGVAQMMTVFASAAGPVIFSTGKRMTASYGFTFQLFAVFMFCMAIAAWVTPIPNPNPDAPLLESKIV